jgi:flavin-dependent dehydrogenase
VRLEAARIHTASKRVLDFPLTPQGYSLSRFALDHALAQEACRLGAEFRQNMRGDAESVAIPAPIVIPAWGRRISENRPGGFFGFKAHFSGEYPPRADVHFFDGGYVGISPVEDGHLEAGHINVCALVERRLVREAETIARHFLGDGPIQDWPFLFTGPLHPGWQAPPGLAAGDAAAFLDPFTGDGISLALRSGQLAARAAIECLNGADARETEARYRTTLRGMCRGQFAAARVLRFGAHRQWLEAPFSWLLEANPRLRRSLFRVTRGDTSGGRIS